ncbi:hypothetical protein EVC30_115 [Rhizobium phage RHph_Y1_11]|nr:hypothetical protein EVC30_115 [Rhizobium phage RHph_Y1_11]
MKLLIPKKIAPPALAKKEIVLPQHTAHAPCPNPPRECTFCKHIYGNPCDGKAGCPNHDFLASQMAEA